MNRIGPFSSLVAFLMTTLWSALVLAHGVPEAAPVAQTSTSLTIAGTVGAALVIGAIAVALRSRNAPS